MTPALRQNLTLAVLVLTGINMRPLLTSIGPLLPDIRAASGMSSVSYTHLRAHET